jgi:CDP-diacylglycerol pyrophosphatase
VGGKSESRVQIQNLEQRLGTALLVVSRQLQGHSFAVFRSVSTVSLKPHSHFRQPQLECSSGVKQIREYVLCVMKKAGATYLDVMRQKAGGKT